MLSHHDHDDDLKHLKIKGELNQKLAKQILEDERTKQSHKHDIPV